MPSSNPDTRASRAAILSALEKAANQMRSPLETTETGYTRQPKPEEIGSPAACARFIEKLGLVGGEGFIFENEAAMATMLRELLEPFRGQVVLITQEEELARLQIPQMLQDTGINVLSPGVDTLEAAALAAAGITTAESGIADTGTIQIWHRADKGRLAALLAPVHIVLLNRNTVYPDKVTYLAEMRRAGVDLGSTPMTWVTGPSLTADIEKILVRGAHGPGRIVVLIYG
jgi:L-lactate dehydrogenase complex protein LldG